MIITPTHVKYANMDPDAFDEILCSIFKKGRAGMSGTIYENKGSNIGIVWDDVLRGFQKGELNLSFYWATYKHLGAGIKIWQSTTFEEIFENLPESTQEKIIFHLDLFL